MVWEQFPLRLQERLRGPAWSKGLRDKFIAISSNLLSVSPDCKCELTTIYVKFMLKESIESRVYAVVWIKNSRKWLVGLAMPPGFVSDKLQLQPKTHKYAGLTQCFYMESDDGIPEELADWASIAHSHVFSQQMNI